MSLNVLWLARTLPFPLDSGDRIYTAGLVKALSRHVSIHYMGIGENDVTTVARTFAPAVTWTAVPAPLRSKWASLLSSRPFVSARHSPGAFVEAVADEMVRTRYDVVVLDQYALGWALDDLGATFARQGNVLMHIAHDFETDVTADIARDYRGNPIKRELLRRNAGKTARMERELARNVDLVGVISDGDAAAFAKLGTKRPPIVLRPGFDDAPVTVSTLSADTPRQAVIVGSFEWLAKQMNLSAFLDEAAPVLATSGIGVDIIGSMPAELRDELSQKHGWVRVRGFVDDLAAELPKYRFGLNIEKTGGGFKLKTLTYVNALLPVAALRASLTGVPERLSEHFLVHSSSADLARAIVANIDDVARLRDLSIRASSLAHELYNWDTTGAQFAAALHACRLAHFAQLSPSAVVDAVQAAE